MSRRSASIVTIHGAEEMLDELPAALRALTAPPTPTITDATRRRYVVADFHHPKVVYYYDVANHRYHTNAVASATLFRRPSIARAVRQALGGQHVVVACEVDDDGRLRAGSLKLPKREPRPVVKPATKKAVTKQRATTKPAARRSTPR